MNVFLGYKCLVSMNEPRLVQYFTARFFVKVISTKNNFRKNVHADFYGYLYVNFVVSVFGPNTGARTVDDTRCSFYSFKSVHFPFCRKDFPFSAEIGFPFLLLSFMSGILQDI